LAPLLEEDQRDRALGHKFVKDVGRSMAVATKYSTLIGELLQQFISFSFCGSQKGRQRFRL